VCCLKGKELNRNRDNKRVRVIALYGNMPKRSIVPDTELSWSVEQQARQEPDLATSAVTAEDMEIAGDLDTNTFPGQPRTTTMTTSYKRKKKLKAAPTTSAMMTNATPSTGTPREDTDDDRKLPARDNFKRSSKKGDRKSNSTTTNRSGEDYSEGTNNAGIAVENSSTTTSKNYPSSSSVASTTKQLLVGKGSEVWNAHLQEIFQNNNYSHKKAPKVTALELLQQAQEQLIFPPTRFPPRESPLHTIFKPTTITTTTTTTTKNTRSEEHTILESLETCYRDMLDQDVNLEETLRNEYKNMKKGTMQKRVGQIFTEESRLKKQEQAMLAKLKGWAASVNIQ